jgi:hypothetical protein
MPGGRFLSCIINGKTAPKTSNSLSFWNFSLSDWLMSHKSLAGALAVNTSGHTDIIKGSADIHT